MAKGKNDQLALVKELSAGTKKHFPNGNQSVQFGGGTKTIAQVTDSLDSFVTLREESQAAKATAQAKLEAENAQATSLLSLVTAWMLFIKATFGNSPEALADFGIPLPKRKSPMSSEAKAAAAAKRKATREARGTKGKKAKQAVKGNVSATLVVTPLAAPQPLAAPVPEPTAPAAPGANGKAPVVNGTAQNGGSTSHQ
jgi:hypothetical protein